jgi:flagellar operon protein
MGRYDLFLRGADPRSIIDPTREAESAQSQEARAGPSFDDILAAQLPSGSVKISTEAQASLKAAGIEMTPLEFDRIGRAIDEVSTAGGQQALLVGEKLALVVDVVERTITAGSARIEAKDRVFSDIDSVMLIE